MMKTYSVCIDFVQGAENTDSVEQLQARSDRFTEAIKSFDGWWAHFSGAYLVRSQHTYKELCNYLAGFVAPSDKLLVLELSGAAAWIGIDGDARAWLEKNIAPSP